MATSLASLVCEWTGAVWQCHMAGHTKRDPERMSNFKLDLDAYIDAAAVGLHGPGQDQVLVSRSKMRHCMAVYRDEVLDLLKAEQDRIMEAAEQRKET